MVFCTNKSVCCCQEMQKHPFFMKNAPEPGDELHPLYEGLQQLKYDPNENTPEGE